MRVLVKRGGQRMWVKDPKKIKFWKAMAETSGRFTPQGETENAAVKILKEVNDD